MAQADGALTTRYGDTPEPTYVSDLGQQTMLLDDSGDPAFLDEYGIAEAYTAPRWRSAAWGHAICGRDSVDSRRF